MNNAQAEKQNWLLDLIKDNAITIALLACSTFITLLNVFAFVKLAPLMQRIELLETKAHANELESDKQQSVNEQIIRIESTVSDIERRTGRIEDKLDRFIERN